jgi:hypothetical protein
MKSLKCFIFGHKWFYGEHEGVKLKPTTRICIRCNIVQNYVGEGNLIDGYCNNDKDWKRIKSNK